MPPSGVRSNDGDRNSSHPGEADPAVVRAQLERILASSPFRNSKRYPALLRYVVERALNGASSELKERNIGIDVFGRDPSYDLSADPVVRVSAGEVRKRLAQYYQETAKADELRIELPLGSYQPEFIVSRPSQASAARPEQVASTARTHSENTRSITRTYLVLAVAVLAVLGLAVFWSSRRPTALDLFWHPVITPGNAVTLCVGRGVAVANGSSASVDRTESGVAWPDAETLARLAGLIQAKGGVLRLVREDLASFSDFQQNPSVLIGAYNDQWTLDLMQKMRYTFQSTGDCHWIADRDRPAFKDWKIDFAKRDSHGNFDTAQDYAVISRVVNPRTGFITVTVAGLWGYGTVASGRFLTEPKYLQELARRSPPGWSNRDMQIVIGTEVIRGSPGPPKVLAAAFW